MAAVLVEKNRDCRAGSLGHCQHLTRADAPSARVAAPMARAVARGSEAACPIGF